MIQGVTHWIREHRILVPTIAPPLNANTEEYFHNHIIPITEETPYVQVHTAETNRVVELECKCDFHPVSLVSMCLFLCTPGFVCVCRFTWIVS